MRTRSGESMYDVDPAGRDAQRAKFPVAPVVERWISHPVSFPTPSGQDMWIVLGETAHVLRPDAVARAADGDGGAGRFGARISASQAMTSIVASVGMMERIELLQTGMKETCMDTSVSGEGRVIAFSWAVHTFARYRGGLSAP